MTGWFAQAWHDITVNASLFPIEAGMLAVMFAVALLVGRRGWRMSWVRGIARRRKLVVVGVFVLALAGRFAVEPQKVDPAPGVHDEFSYLLAADTFAEGRLTNPAHPMRYFLESFHVLMEPTYMSMYPPGQGMALALGTLVGGRPIVGVWLSAAGACAAICWMLQGWMPPIWALAGGVLCVVRIGWFSYWANSYWGGCVAMLGGALVLGAVARLMRRPTRGAGIIFGFGSVILANTRPYEGLILVSTVVLWLIWNAVRSGTGLAKWKEAILAAGAVGGAGILVMGYYNYKLTGDALLTPYQLHRNRYAIHQHFVWQKPVAEEKAYPHEIQRAFYVDSEGYAQRVPYASIQASKLLSLWMFFLGPALTAILIGLAWGGWRGNGVLPMLGVSTFIVGHGVIGWMLLPHYAGPIVGCIYILLLRGMRVLSLRGRQRRMGLALRNAVLLTCAGMFVMRGFGAERFPAIYQEPSFAWYNYGRQANYPRWQMERKLGNLGTKHLVLVHYDAGHSADMEWVYNRADVDGSSVVWARHVADRGKLQELLNYYKDRRVWMIFPDRSVNHIYDFKELDR